MSTIKPTVAIVDHALTMHSWLKWRRLINYLTIIPRECVGYGMVVANDARSAELAIIMSYPTRASDIIVLLKTPPKY